MPAADGVVLDRLHRAGAVEHHGDIHRRADGALGSPAFQLDLHDDLARAPRAEQVALGQDAKGEWLIFDRKRIAQSTARESPVRKRAGQ